MHVAVEQVEIPARPLNPEESTKEKRVSIPKDTSKPKSKQYHEVPYHKVDSRRRPCIGLAECRRAATGLKLVVVVVVVVVIFLELFWRRRARAHTRIDAGPDDRRLRGDAVWVLSGRHDRCHGPDRPVQGRFDRSGTCGPVRRVRAEAGVPARLRAHLQEGVRPM